ncbi:hypothetical protein [Halobacteriovorax sp. ZH4_bin.1]|uniref:hypothetical protein n=2 Tax=Halobacteriovorax TaxID=1652133 RepID=UPI003721DF8F
MEVIIKAILRSLFIISFVGVFAGMLFYTKDIKQKNPESIFLTDEGMYQFRAFQQDYPEVDSLVVYTNETPSEEAYLRLEKFGNELAQLCDDECYFVYPHDLVKERAILTRELIKGVDAQADLISSNRLGFLIFNNGKKSQLKDVIRKIEENQSFFCAGHEYTNYHLDQSSALVQEKLFPILFVFSFILLLAFIRNFLATLLLFVPCLFSAIFSLAVIKFFFGTMNMVTSIVPLMTFVIVLSLGQHIYFTARKEGSLSLALKKKIKPISLMLVTTFIGFLSLYVSEIYVIRVFGLLSSLMILLSSLVSMLWLLSVEKVLKLEETAHVKLSKYPGNSLSGASLFLICSISLFIGIWGAMNIDIITDATKYFPKDTAIARSFNEISPIAGGVPLLEIGMGDLSYEDLKKISNIEDELGTLAGVSVMSRNLVVRKINQAYSGHTSLPDNQFAYATLYSKAAEGIREAYPIDSFYKITLLGTPLNVDQYEDLLVKVRNTLGEKTYILDGLYYNLMISQKAMVHTLSKSFLLSLFIMAIIAVISLKQLKLFMIFILVNTMPLGLSLGFLNLTGMSLNIATVMTYSVGLGIVVDSTFHLLHFFDERRGGFLSYVETIVKPILTSSLTLIIAFLLFGIYDFLPIREFGVNLSFILFCGMIFDLFVLPTLYLGSSSLKEVMEDWE